MVTFRVLTAAALLFFAAQRPSLAGSATWSNNPSSGDWNDATNWMPNTVPNGTSDIATFGTSNVTDVFNPGVIINLDSMVFNPDASLYTISAYLNNIALYGSGIVNNSGMMQSFIAGTFFFNNSATAGNMTNFNGAGGAMVFNDSSSAGSATINLSEGISMASVLFFDSSTAGNATINASDAEVGLFENATGGNAVFSISDDSFLGIVDNATADHAVATCIGGNQFAGSGILFQGFGSASEGTFAAVGASSSGEKGAYIEFDGSATAANATFTVGGGLGAGFAATTLTFIDTTTAAAANITANGGVNGSDGGAVIFAKKSKGGTASITLNGNAQLDISTHNAPGVTIGSLAGKGSVLLGANTLTVGSNNQNTTFSGVIQDTGSLAKTGTGTLNLSGANTYTGATTISAGVLKASNRTGSATGTGAVNLNAGTLGGGGIIAGPTTIGTGSGAGAFLQPGVGASKPTTLSIQGLLTLKSDSTYTYKLNTKKAKADQVMANGVTIQGGAQFSFNAISNQRLQQGQVFTAISNTSASPISGTFVNLADGSIFTAGRNKFQVSYEGGDGNDLTLTVVP